MSEISEIDGYAEKPRPLPVRDILLLAHAGVSLLNGTAHLVRQVRELRRARRSHGGHGSRGDQQRQKRHQSRRSTRRNSEMQTITLYRPVGQAELDLIVQADGTAFPPRLAQQPIFYPVLNEEYATEIARDWNTRDPFSGYVGYVTRFEVRADFLSHYDVKTVGAERHQEYWIPAEDLPRFNACIVGSIAVIATFRGEGQ